MKNLKNKKIFIGGIQGSGKTQATKYIVTKFFKRAISVRISPDYDNLKNIVLVSEGKDYLESIETVAKYLVHDGEKVKEGLKSEPEYDVFVIDEFDLALDSKSKLTPNLNKLFLMHRHYKVAIIGVTRRMQDIPSKFVEACHHKLFYKIEGMNVYKYIANIDKDILPIMEKIEFEKHNFCYKELGKQPLLHKALPLID